MAVSDRAGSASRLLARRRGAMTPRCALLQVPRSWSCLAATRYRGWCPPRKRPMCRDQTSVIFVRGLLRVSGDRSERRTGRQLSSIASIAIGWCSASLKTVRSSLIVAPGTALSDRLGAVGHHQPRRAVETGAHDFVAEPPSPTLIWLLA